ncbi:hypothetical protein P5673_000084 [Acropora cervicornis]|uniref:Uncharacterized protein n=1 Tax=Acropora cervicornis TaxID=6130 RepID=A0AAD9R6K1_ACRCE|nr:hypothetical protein P5673_000084 [Acropora cervicornis]
MVMPSKTRKGSGDVKESARGEVLRFDFAISLSTQKLKLQHVHSRRLKFMAEEDRISLIYPEISTGSNWKSGSC